VVVVNAETFIITRKFGVPGRGVIAVAWHLKINQIVIGCSDGNVKVTSKSWGCPASPIFLCVCACTCRVYVRLGKGVRRGRGETSLH